MVRKKPQGGHVNLERWLVSWADFMTLLFAFFVVMFASAHSDKDKARQVSDSVRRALAEGHVAAVIAAILGTPSASPAKEKAVGGPETKAEGGPYPVADLLPTLDFLTAELKDEISAGKLQLRLESRGLVVSLTEAAFFPTGQDTINPAGYGSIGKIAEAIRKLPNPVRLEGHTDSVPIHNERFRSNWELSVARGIAMLRLLVERFGVPQSQLSVAGYADQRPAGPNETEGGRARNRRVDIVILSKAAYELEPGVEARKAAAH
ncbi:MAG TPA: flagellar motor protein MotB [Bryobacteraceae bacterium]|nr:flagellar motor protein MotB [Bryobacteraceae bacterium]HOL73565.1 flagellar motor protein MotB [Bryobacteraceae bacterium]HOQ45471.1 flagellar motor protein MotB [Bryobacteraceae bacterium]HPU73679.1 flagellar motor protein MotB [Bryobacteraceae bacterium]